MKNVTKILIAVTLCAAVFASTQRIGSLGGNAAFWPGDEANIAAFPAQINNHGYLQLSGVGGDGADADLVFNHNGTAWGLGFQSGNGNQWFDLGWGNGSMGINVAMNNYDSGVGATDTGTGLQTATGMALSWGQAFDWGEIGVSYTSYSSDTITTSYVMEDCTGDDTWTSGDAASCDNSVDDTSEEVDDLMSCTDGGGSVAGDWTDCTNNTLMWNEGGFTWTAAEDCTGEGEIAGDNCTVVAADACSSGNTTDEDACDAEGDACSDGLGTLEADCDNNTSVGAGDGNVDSCTGGDDDPSDGCDNSVENSATYIAGVDQVSPTTDDENNGIMVNFRKACDFWIFDTMVGSLNMPDEGDMDLSASWFTHMDAGGATVMVAMGVDIIDAGDDVDQTAAVAVEAPMTDWATLRAGVNWSYPLVASDDVIGATTGWAMGLGFNWGGFTADYSLSTAAEGKLFNDPVGTFTGFNGGFNDAAAGADDPTQSVTLTYSF